MTSSIASSSIVSKPKAAGFIVAGGNPSAAKGGSTSVA